MAHMLVIALLVTPSAMAQGRHLSPSGWRVYMSLLDSGSRITVHLERGAEVSGELVGETRDALHVRTGTSADSLVRVIEYDAVQSINVDSTAFTRTGRPGATVRVQLATGARIEGRIIGVTTDGVRLAVRRETTQSIRTLGFDDIQEIERKELSLGAKLSIAGAAAVAGFLIVFWPIITESN